LRIAPLAKNARQGGAMARRGFGVCAEVGPAPTQAKLGWGTRYCTVTETEVLVAAVRIAGEVELSVAVTV
jgi:hypothetical protein